MNLPNSRFAVFPPTRASHGVRALCARSAAALLLATMAFGCTLEDEVKGDDFAAFADDAEADGMADMESDTQQLGPCDMTGNWIVEQETKSLALGLEATSYNLYYLEITDEGDEIVVDRGWDCGFSVRGSAVVDTGVETRVALAQVNRMEGVIDATVDPPITVEPRRGVFKPVSEGSSRCEFSMERWWQVRGGLVDLLPDRADYSTTSIEQIENEEPMPTRDDFTGNRDLDEDGNPGIRLEVTQPLFGTRHSVLRDWNEFGPFEVSDGATDFEGVAQFDNQESILQASSNLLLLAGSPQPDGHDVRFVKINEQAPEDVEDFIDWCNANVVEFFEAQRER